MKDRTGEPAYALHALVAMLDRAADQILKDGVGITYSRFLTLLTLQRLGSATQRELSAELGVSEPSISRAVPLLTAEGWVAVSSAPGSGNRRQVRLTTKGERLVDEAADLLEGSFSALLEIAGVRASDVLAVTSPLLEALSPDAGGTS
jgi:DNA-binding MarR family transcriptional regulator